LLHNLNTFRPLGGVAEVPLTGRIHRKITGKLVFAKNYTMLKSDPEKNQGNIGKKHIYFIAAAGNLPNGRTF